MAVRIEWFALLSLSHWERESEGEGLARQAFGPPLNPLRAEREILCCWTTAACDFNYACSAEQRQTVAAPGPDRVSSESDIPPGRRLCFSAQYRQIPGTSARSSSHS